MLYDIIQTRLLQLIPAATSATWYCKTSEFFVLKKGADLQLYMASLSPLPKENLLHCDIVGSLDIFTCWFLCFFVHRCVSYLSATRFWWIKLCVWIVKKSRVEKGGCRLRIPWITFGRWDYCRARSCQPIYLRRHAVLISHIAEAFYNQWRWRIRCSIKSNPLRSSQYFARTVLWPLIKKLFTFSVRFIWAGWKVIAGFTSTSDFIQWARIKTNIGNLFYFKRRFSNVLAAHFRDFISLLEPRPLCRFTQLSFSFHLQFFWLNSST